MNVEKAWLQGITGEGVIVGVVDDGEWYYIHKVKRMTAGKMMRIEQYNQQIDSSNHKYILYIIYNYMYIFIYLFIQWKPY